MVAQIQKREISFAKFTVGLERFLIGLFKKVLIADLLREMVTSMMSASALDSLSAWILVIAYGFQLYFDFSGYSDMAIGVSKLFGFDFKENFNFPYTATSVSDFWRRWHISLGDWFREYVYIPLGGNREGNVYLHLFVVFVLTGLWHGNTNIFLYWGIAHGLMVVLERTPLYAKIKEKLSPSLFKAIGWCYTMAVVFLGWTCFWIGDVASFVNFLKLLLGIGEVGTSFTWQYYLRPRLWILIGISVVGIVLFSRSRVQTYLRTKNECSKIFNIVKYVVFLGLFAVAFSFMTANGFAPFLYFQF